MAGFLLALVLGLVSGWPAWGEPSPSPASSATDTPGVLASATSTSEEGTETRIRDLLTAGQLEEAVAEVDRWLAALPDPEPAKPRLAAALHQAAAARLAAAPAADWPAAEAGPVEAAARKARDLAPDQLPYWQTFLDCVARQAGTEATLTFEGQDLLDRHGSTLRRQPPPGLVPILQRLNEIFDQRGFPLHRLEVLQILALHPATASEAARLLPMARETVKLRSAELLERIEAAMVMNELGQAQSLLDRLKAAQPDLPQLTRLTTRLDTIRKVQDLLNQTYGALQRKDTALAKRLCQQVLELDPNNFNARAYLDQMATPAASGTAAAHRPDPQAARKSELARRLSQAEAEEDLAEIRRVIKEMIFVGIAKPAHFRRLAEVEKELATARLFARDRFEHAQRLLIQEDWEGLRRFLNRNPTLGSNLERIAAVWDMRLAATYFTGARDDDEILADAARIAEKNPKSFWSPYVRMKIALRRNEMAEAEKHLEAARAVASEHKYLIWPGRLLWVWRHGWKIVPFILLAFFYAAAQGMFWFLHWWETGYWSRTAFIGRFLPRLALASLERRFGTVKEDWARQKMFEQLTEFAFACGLKEKGVRYAELLLEIKNQHPLAMQLLARHHLAKPLKAQQLDFFFTYLKLFPDDKDAVQKVGRFLLAGKQLKPDHLDLARRYMAFFPQDQDMVVAVGQLLQDADLLSMTTEGLDLLEKAWRVSGEDSLWWAMWRAQVVKGNFERAMALLTEALQAGRPIQANQLPAVLESQLDPLVMALQRNLSGFDKTKQGEAQSRLTNLNFVTARQEEMLLPYLDGAIGDHDPGVRYTAQKARDHLRKARERSDAFIARLLEMGGAAPAAASSEAAPGEPSPAGYGADSAGETAVAPSGEPAPEAAPFPGEPAPAPAFAPFDAPASANESGPRPEGNMLLDLVTPAAGTPPTPGEERAAALKADSGEIPAAPLILEDLTRPDPSVADQNEPYNPDRAHREGLLLTGGIRYDEYGNPMAGPASGEPPAPAYSPATDLTGWQAEPGDSGRSGESAELPLTGGVDAPAVREALPTTPPPEPGFPEGVIAWPGSEGSPDDSEAWQAPAPPPPEAGSPPLPRPEPPAAPRRIDGPELDADVGGLGGHRPPTANTRHREHPHPDTGEASPRASAPLSPRVARPSIPVALPPPAAPDGSLGSPGARHLFSDLDAIATPPPPPAHPPGPVARQLFDDLPGPAPRLTEGALPAPSLDDESLLPPMASPAPAAPNPAIAALPEAPSVEELTLLLEASTAADLPAWEEFLRRPPSLRSLEIVVKSLGRLRSAAVTDVLRPFLQHPISRVRANAIEGLLENADPGAIRFLIPFLKDEDNRIRANAIKALSQFGVESILEEVGKMVEDDRPRMRDSATWVLKGLRGKEAAAMLQRLLYDPETNVRQNAIRSLAQQGDPSNAEALQAFLAAAPDPEDAALARKALDYIQTARKC